MTAPTLTTNLSTESETFRANAAQNIVAGTNEIRRMLIGREVIGA
jgi:alkylation response protein AidB-like acyl-CoA dehydrogenase